KAMSTYDRDDPEIIKKLDEFILDEDFDSFLELFRSLHAADQAKMFNQLKTDQQEDLLQKLDIPEIADIFDELDDKQTLIAARNLPLAFLADIIDDMDPDQAADLLGDLTGQEVRNTMSLMDEPEEVLPLLRYPDETAGGRMTTDFIALNPSDTADTAIQHLRSTGWETDIPYFIFVVNQEKELLGVIGIRELVIAQPGQKIIDIMETNVVSVQTMQDQEEAARVMKHYDLQALPVLNQKGHLVGVISHDDILDVLEDESTEDLYRLASVSDYALEPESKLLLQLKGRLPWLLLNTITALIGSWVISNFSELFIQVAVLAFFQSVVAAQGGNAASQNVALIVRSLALGKIKPHQILPILFRQIVVGMFLGTMIGLIVGFGVGFWQSNPYLGLVLGLALLGNMLVASIVGTLAPLLLEFSGQDPAMASSVLVTAITDIIGFLIFLSLASLFLPLIQQYI
ncbi:MAG: magnesium transporter, partial [Anaerolineales bacterium]|nr:magnesium transporter [Anaerolineales bacterium]